MGTNFPFRWNWTEMCGPEGLQPWNENVKDLGICFQQLYLDLPVLFLIAISSAYYVGSRRDWVTRGKLQENVITLRAILTLIMSLAPVIHLYILLTKEAILYPILYLVSGTETIAWLMHFLCLLNLRKCLGISPRGPVILIVWWTSNLMLTVLQLRSRILVNEDYAFVAITLFIQILYLITLIPSEGSCNRTYYSPYLVGSQYSQFSEYSPLLQHADEDLLGTALQGESFWSKLFFFWVEPLFKKGLQEKLKVADDLFDLPTNYRCTYIGHRIDHALVGNIDKYPDRVVEPFMTSVEPSSPATSYGATTQSRPENQRRILVTPTRRHHVTLLRALHSCFAFHFYTIGILKFAADMSGFAGPVLLNKVLNYIEDDAVDPQVGYLYALGLLTTSAISAVCTAHFNMQMALVGVKMRSAIISTILRKTMSVTSSMLSRSFSVGEITNFMSTDTDRIVNACPSFHAVWSIPLQMFLALFLLYKQVGISFLAGVAFSVLLIPVNKFIANKIAQISTELMHHKDKRVSLMSEVIRGVRTIKLHVWEDYFISKINVERKEELKYLKLRKYLDAICVVFWATTPILVSVLTLSTYSLLGNSLNAATVFTSVALMNMLIAPLNAFPWVLNGIMEAWVSIKRIQKLLELEDMDAEKYFDKINLNQVDDTSLILKNATFEWPNTKLIKTKTSNKKKQKNKGKSSKKISKVLIDNSQSNSSSDFPQVFSLKNLNISIKKGHLIGVVGKIGSGKTSFLQAIIGEMIKKNGEILIDKRLDGFSYVSQTPWLQRGTIRDNILFGKTYDDLKYREIIDACCLTVYLLDDILSAVDAKVAHHIFKKCVCTMLRNKTRILVTHSLQFLEQANHVVLLEDGRIKQQGPPNLVLHDIVEHIQSDSDSLIEDTPCLESSTDIENINTDNISQVADEDEEEHLATGTIDWWVIAMYIKSIGIILTVCIMISIVLMQVTNNVTFLWLSYWVNSENPRNSTNTTQFFYAVNIDKSATTPSITAWRENANINPDVRLNHRSSKWYLYIYIALAGVNVVFTTMRAFLFAYGGIHAASRIHKKLLMSVTKGKMKFFELTPAGRILNRFSSDTYTVDDSLPFILNILLAQVFGLLGSLVVTLYGLPWIFLVLIPLLPIYHWLLHRYRKTSRELKRLHSITLSPIYSHFSEALEGMTIIRAFKADYRVISNGEELVELSQRASLSASAAAAWLTLRLYATGVTILTAAALVAVAQKHFHLADAGLIGLAISYALSVTSLLSGVMNAFPETEREMIAVERVGEYTRHVEPEQSESIDLQLPMYGWPQQGVVSFDDVVMKYNEKKQPALRGVTFCTRPGEKVGIVGRTGAGKSSIFAALLRLTEIHSGKIVVDSVEIRNLNLAALRSRIAVIPQEPFIFSGTIRENIDPLREYTDEEIHSCLDKCGAIDLLIDHGGLECRADHVPKGMAQLLCLTRALLHKAKIICIDEATANIDEQTDKKIQDAIRSSFRSNTVLTIAHRISTILDSDRVLVMGDGQILEFDSPEVLMQDVTSNFYELLNLSSIGH